MTTNTPVTLTTLYSYDYYGASITNTNQNVGAGAEVLFPFVEQCCLPDKP